MTGGPDQRARAHTMKDWVEACAARGIRLKRTGKEYSGPCPLCGGEDRFHVGPGDKQLVVASCRHGHGFEDLVRELFPRGSYSGGPGRASVVKPRPSVARHPKGPRRTERPSKPPYHLRIWEQARPVPPDEDSPPRQWAARRQLWRPHLPFPSGLRWREFSWVGDKLCPNAIVACYASLRAWRTAVNGSREEAIRTGKANRPAVPVPTPGRVELLHVSMDGQPVKDQGDPPLTKRSHGNLPGAVLVLNQNSLNGPWPVHITEGVADGLAIAARKRGPVIVAGGTSGVKALANSPEELIRSAGRVTVWVWPDGDEAGRAAASDLVAALRERGAGAQLMPMPEGEDPASIAPPFKPNEGV